MANNTVPDAVSSPADWDTWGDIPDVEVWKAVALSLNHEPEHLAGLDLRPAWGTSFDDCPQEFQRRLKIAEAAASAGTLRLSGISMGYPTPYQMVNLGAFCSWTQSLRKPWQLPNAMSGLVQHSEIEAEQPKEVAQAEPQAEETPYQRRHRWLTEREACGSLVMVHKSELKSNPRADRSNIGKQIKKARQERDTKRREQATPTQPVTSNKSHPFAGLGVAQKDD
jgi:hypothetical protein